MSSPRPTPTTSRGRPRPRTVTPRSTAPPPSTTQLTPATRAAVVSTIEDTLRDGKFDTLGDDLAGEDYVQHNPRFADGISGLVTAVTALAEQGITMSYTGINHAVAQGDFGYTRSEGQFAGAPFVFHDLFRVVEGKYVEHWDVMVPVA